MTQILEVPPPPALTRGIVRINAEQYHRLIEDGIYPEDSSTELLDGFVVYKDVGDTGDEPMGHGPLHRLAVRLLTKLAARIDNESRHLQIQLPVHLAENREPEPDGAIVLGADGNYADHLPGPQDIATIIEVSNSSLALDSGTKRDFYAAAGIAQYVIVNLRDRRIEIQEMPDKEKRTYSSFSAFTQGLITLNLGNGESLEVAVEALLP